MKRTLVSIAGLLLGTATLAAPAGDKVAEGTDWVEPASGMAFRAIPKGCFKMGAETPQVPQPEIFWERAGYRKTASEDERPVHEVCVDGFWMGKYEVRLAEWQQVMGGAPARDGNVPVTHVTWGQAEEFARRLSEQSPEKYRFRLPTEAEWEYACRAGSGKDIDPFSDGADKFAWYQFIHGNPQPAGGLQANAFGLHDMLGNVWEWVADSYVPGGYAKHALYNPQVKNPGGPKVLRGGSFRTERVQVRCAMRGRHAPEMGSDAIGFRLVRER